MMAPRAGRMTNFHYPKRESITCHLLFEASVIEPMACFQGFKASDVRHENQDIIPEKSCIKF